MKLFKVFLIAILLAFTASGTAWAGAIYDVEAGGTVDASGASVFAVTAVDGRYNLGVSVDDTVFKDLDTVEGHYTIQIMSIDHNTAGDDETGVTLWFKQSNVNSASAWALVLKTYIAKNVTLGGASTYVVPFYPNDGVQYVQTGIEDSGATPIHKVTARQIIK